MVEFFEPEDDYQFDNSRRKNIKTKITLLTVLIIFGSILILAVQFDFINVFGKNKIKESCSYNSSYNQTNNDEIKMEKAKKALKDHTETIKELNGFVDMSIELDKLQKNLKIPVIKLTFKKMSVDKVRVPENLCGFPIIINSL